jgi:hypothetical protein
MTKSKIKGYAGCVQAMAIRLNSALGAAACVALP